MRKKLMVGIIVATMFVSSGITYASTKNYYAELLAGQTEQIKQSVEDIYVQEYKQAQEQVHADMVSYVQTNREELESSVIKYLKDSADNPYDLLAQHTAEVDKEAQRMEKELFDFVDNLLNK